LINAIFTQRSAEQARCGVWISRADGKNTSCSA